MTIEGGCGNKVEVGRLFGGRVLGDTLCSLRDGVLGQFTGEDESDGCLDLTG